MKYLQDLQSGIYNFVRKSREYIDKNKGKIISVGAGILAVVGLGYYLMQVSSAYQNVESRLQTLENKPPIVQIYKCKEDCSEQKTTQTLTQTLTASPTQECGHLKIFKFYDSNGNGVWEEGEDPFPGIGFEIEYPDGHKKTVYTGKDGYALLSCLAFGEYKIREMLPDGWEVTTKGNHTVYIKDEGLVELRCGNIQVPVKPTITPSPTQTPTTPTITPSPSPTPTTPTITPSPTPTKTPTTPTITPSPTQTPTTPTITPSPTPTTPTITPSPTPTNSNNSNNHTITNSNQNSNNSNNHTITNSNSNNSNNHTITNSN
ncbi:MAG: SpaA isopeptide-forming pilin-related protein, partial [Candidatus Aenigmatarchaeota archaeon]